MSMLFPPLADLATQITIEVLIPAHLKSLIESGCILLDSGHT
jgi:hypothetical protein